MIFKKNKNRGFILPAVLIFLSLLGALAIMFAFDLGMERQLSESQNKMDREKLVCLSAIEHVKALFEAAEINHPGSWLSTGSAGPYRVDGLDYSVKITPIKDNACYQEFWGGDNWIRQSAASLASQKEMLANLKRENKDAEDRILEKLALTVSDACDENHSLQENAGIYGAEAVDFSEILSDDGSELRFAYRANAVYKERAVTSLPYFYGGRDYDSTAPVTESRPELREHFDPRTARHVLKDECKRENGSVYVKLSADALTEDNESSLLKSWQKKKQAQFPVNHLWQNCRIAFFGLAVKGITPRAVFKISDSDGINIILKDEEGLFNSITNSSFRYAQLRGWVHSETLYSEAQNQTLWISVSDLQKEKYYEVQLQDANFPVPIKDETYGNNRNRKLIVGSEEIEADKYAFDYTKGRPLKSSPEGEMELVVKSPNDCSPNKRVRVNSVYFRRPDIVAIINKSTSPILLSGWRLTAQTGSGSTLLGILPDEAALIPGSRFYLTDQSDIVCEEYGFQPLDSKFSSRDAVITLPKENWGLDYEISGVREIKKGAQYYTIVSCKNALWEKDELIDEVAEIKDGLRFPIEGGNTKNTLIFSNLRLERYANLEAGDRLRILGLPRHFEYASLTLKNESSQVAARTKGIKRPKEAILFSSLKYENDAWRVNKVPFRNFTPAESKTFFDRPLTNDTEVISALDDSRLANAYLHSNALSLYVKEFPASKAGFKGDWSLAGGRANKCEKGLAFQSADWPRDFWRGQKARILSGELKGETFAVTGSFENVVCTGTHSLPGRKRLNCFKEGMAALGPGYKNIFYTAWKNNAQGEWTFSNLWDCADGELYLKGLSDAVDSGEFLEENHNALIQPELFDWRNNNWERFPSFRYKKNDAAYLTTLGERHISPKGYLKLKLTAKNINDPKGSGRAWFQGIAVSPIRRPVKVTEEVKVARGPIPLTVPPELYAKKEQRYHLTALFRLEVTVASRSHFYLLTVGPTDPRTNRRKISFQKLAF